MDADLFVGIAALVLTFAGGLFARFFPRLGLVIGYSMVIAAWGAFFYLMAVLMKHFGPFWGFVLGAVFAVPATLATHFAGGMIRVGHGVLEDEEAAKMRPQPVGAEPPGYRPTVTPDIETYIQRHFLHGEREEARRLVEEARLPGGRELGPRLARCALVASAGSLEALRGNLQRARTRRDDLIMAAECSPGKTGELVRIRDLNLPIDERA